MKTTFRAREPFASMFLDCARNARCDSPARPRRFITAMEQNKGGIAALSGLGLDAEGMERKNPVIAALGDSVTAGHFENIMLHDPKKWFAEVARRIGMDPEEIDMTALGDQATAIALVSDLASRLPEGVGLPAGEITDARESYVEKFRLMLIDRYEETSVSVINAGIAGDNLIMMEKRLKRDVLRYQPDLALLNGSLNWDDSMGTTAFYEQLLERTVVRMQNETEADIVLLTPNGIVADDCRCRQLEERVEAIRSVAVRRGVSLADAYAVWKAAAAEGCPWAELLANGSNHPGAEGHEVYAITLMKLLEA